MEQKIYIENGLLDKLPKHFANTTGVGSGQDLLSDLDLSLKARLFGRS